MPKNKERPPHIVAAIERGDTEYLSQCGRKGARITHQIRRAIKQAQVEAQEAERLAALEVQRQSYQRFISEWWQYHVIPGNCHIIDADGRDLNYVT